MLITEELKCKAIGCTQTTIKSTKEVTCTSVWIANTERINRECHNAHILLYLPLACICIALMSL